MNPRRLLKGGSKSLDNSISLSIVMALGEHLGAEKSLSIFGMILRKCWQIWLEVI